MIKNVTVIDEPYSGEYEEIIYDFDDSYKSGDWSWIKFDEEDYSWCGEFRGKSRGAVLSNKLGIVVILTSDYMYILDIKTKELIEYEYQPLYIDVTCTPNDDILLNDGYHLKMFKDKKISNIISIELPLNVDNLQFIGYSNNMLEMKCEEFYNWNHDVFLEFDCDSLKVNIK